MKTSMMKLGAFVMIASIALFVAAATPSAFGHEWSNTIRGKFAVTGFNACLAAFPPGFDPITLQPIDGSSSIDAQSWEGVYTFTSKGKGALDVIAHDVGGAGLTGGWSASFHWEFNYTVDHTGKITFTLVPGSYIGKFLTGPYAPSEIYEEWDDPSYGVISPDGNHMFVTWGAPSILYILDSQGGKRTGVQLICNGSFVLFRLQ
jgi:hypothetical protein